MFNNFKEKLRYSFDNLMAKGTVALVAVLFLATAAVIILAALLAVIFGNSTFGQNIWAGLMHTIDAGTITGTDTADLPFLIIMSAVTLCGLFVTSILIGIITTGFEEKLNTLKKGNSQVVEKNHTLILGFNDNIYTIISELIIANESSKSECIVVLCVDDKETVEEAIANHIDDYKTTRVVCRTGSTTDVNMLKRCSISTCRSVIINETDDFITTKAILAINNYFNEIGKKDSMPCIVASVHEEKNYDAATIASEGNVEIMLTDDTISRIIAQTCRQSGLSNVMTELFDFDGDELYFESFSELVGMQFGEVLNMFDKAIVFGYKRDNKVHLNPDMHTVLKADDELILLMEDNNSVKPKEYKQTKQVEVLNKTIDAQEKLQRENVLILGANNMLHRILKELDNYSSKGAIVTIAHEEATSFIRDDVVFNNIEISFIDCDTANRTSLDELANANVDNIVLLSNDECDMEQSDAQMLLKLIHIRDICEKTGLVFNITSEMKNPSNQKLAKIAKVNDFVIGNYIVNMIMAQISENRHLSSVFNELLRPEGNEIYIQSAQNYIDIEKEIDFYDITEIVKQNGEIAIGYKLQREGSIEIITNPLKSEKVKFSKDDCIILLSD